MSDILEIPVDAELIDRLDELVTELSTSQAAREFGVVVTRGMAGRLALMRGMAILQPPPAISAVEAQPVPSEALESDEGDDDGDDILRTDTAGVGDDVAVIAGPDGLLRVPDGWNRWSASERVPDDHGDVHKYYTKNGWDRFWGRVDNEVIAFYWSPDPARQGLELFSNEDTVGKKVTLQKTPFGPGHMVPHGWLGRSA